MGVKIGYFRTDSDLLYHDEIHGDLFSQVEKTVDLLLTKYLRAGISYEGVQRVEAFPVPESALREAVINAIVHKGYASAIPIQISVYHNKLMIWNAGQLPDDWTIESLLELGLGAGCLARAGRLPSGRPSSDQRTGDFDPRNRPARSVNMGTHRLAFVAGALLGLWLLAAVAGQAVAQSGPVAPLPPTPRFQLESIRVEPPGGEAELLVRRNLSLHPGQMVDAATLVQARRQLAATGLFIELDLYTTRGSRPGAVIAVVVARPSRHFYLATGAGRDPIRGSYLNVASLRRLGLFGRGGIARVTFRVAQRIMGLYADLEVPALLPRETDLLLNAGRYRQTWTIEQGDSTRFQKIDCDRYRVGARHRLTDDVSAVLWAGYSQARPKQSLEGRHDPPKIPAAGLVPVYKDDLRYGELQLSLTRDRLDVLRPWQRGSWEGLILRGASPRSGERFWGSELDIHRTLPVAGTRAAAFRLHAAYTSADTPYFLRPIVGGVGSVRGFPDAGLSGPLGARAFCQLTAEWRHPLIGSNPQRPLVIATLFADGGDHWAASGERADPAVGAGCGALVRLPWLQTLNLELAYPLTDQVDGRPAAFYLSLGRSF